MIVSIGEALIDMIQREDGLFEARPGGAPSNTAIALARLGHDSQLAGRISRTGFGPNLLSRLIENGVGVDLIMEAQEPTSLAIASISPEGGANYQFYIDGTADWQWSENEIEGIRMAGPTAVHFGSLAAAIMPGSQLIETLIKQLRESERTVVSYDINVRPSLGFDTAAERERIERQVRLAHIIKASEDDLLWLYPTVPIDQIATRWARTGRFVITTHGGRGATLTMPGGKSHTVSAHTIDVVDTIGAGDAFCGGLLARLNELDALGKGISGLMECEPDAWLSALDYASKVAAFTCTQRGAEPPTRLELMQFATA